MDFVQRLVAGVLRHREEEKGKKTRDGGCERVVNEMKWSGEAHTGIHAVGQQNRNDLGLRVSAHLCEIGYHAVTGTA